MVEPCHIYLSVEPGQWLAGELLRYSLLKRTKAQVQFHELQPYAPSKGSIPLSFARWFIPRLQHHKGRALFLTANKIVLEDIEKLFGQEMPRPALACPVTHPPGAEGFYTDLMLLDCGRLSSWDPDEWLKQISSDPNQAAQLLGLPGSPSQPDLAPLDPNWNSHDELTAATKILSFTDLKTQPWRNRTHPHRHLFLKELKEAVEAEEISLQALLEEIRLGHLYPKVIEELAAYDN